MKPVSMENRSETGAQIRSEDMNSDAKQEHPDQHGQKEPDSTKQCVHYHTLPPFKDRFLFRFKNAAKESGCRLCSGRGPWVGARLKRGCYRGETNRSKVASS